jgi:enoyl-[acyl-carrier protein] reductase II
MPMHRFSNLLPMRGATSGDLEEMAMPAGLGVGLVSTVESAGTLVASMTAQARAALDRYGPSVTAAPSHTPSDVAVVR